MSITIIDRGLLQELLMLGQEVDQPLVKRFLDKFKKDFPVHLENLQRLTLQNDFSEMERITHLMKGSAGSLGAIWVCELCGELEHQASQKINISLDQIEMLRQRIVKSISLLDEFTNEEPRLSA